MNVRRLAITAITIATASIGFNLVGSYGIALADTTPLSIDCNFNTVDYFRVDIPAITGNNGWSGTFTVESNVTHSYQIEVHETGSLYGEQYIGNTTNNSGGNTTIAVNMPGIGNYAQYIQFFVRDPNGSSFQACDDLYNFSSGGGTVYGGSTSRPLVGPYTPPTNTPTSTNTPVPTATSTNTPTATSTVTPTNTAVSGGVIGPSKCPPPTPSTPEPYSGFGPSIKCGVVQAVGDNSSSEYAAVAIPVAVTLITALGFKAFKNSTRV